MLSPFDLWCRLTLKLLCGFCSRWSTFWWKWNAEVTIYCWIYGSQYLSELGTPVFGANLHACTCYVFFSCVAFLLPLRQGLTPQTHYSLEAVLELPSLLSLPPKCLNYRWLQVCSTISVSIIFSSWVVSIIKM